ncbi:Protein SKIP34 [Linum grandiflorum]
MCCGRQSSSSPRDLIHRSRNRRSPDDDGDEEEESAIEALRSRLAETEARLERARAREAELSRRLEEMKRYLSVLEILESYLKRRFNEQQERVACLFSSIAAKLKSLNR